MIDHIDQKIITELAQDGRASVEKIAELVGLSPTPTRRRIKMLEEKGIIDGYHVRLDPAKCGLGLSVIALVKLVSGHQYELENFERAICEMPEAVQCMLITGEYDYLVEFRLKDMSDYDRFLRSKVHGLNSVSSISSQVVVAEVKKTNLLPLNR